MNDITIQLADWETDHLQLMKVRTRVFIEEQNVPEELEIDGLDAHSFHIKALLPDQKIIATARLLTNNYIGRMCVLKAYRNQGTGGKMLQFLIDFAYQLELAPLQLNAQLSALAFYQHYGFVKDSAVFQEAGIDHVHMTLSLS